MQKMTIQRKLQAAPYLVCSVGIVLHGSVALFFHKESFDAAAFWLMIWSSMPYLVCMFIAAISRNPLSPLIGSLAALVFDVFNLYSVFIDPLHSTAPLGLIFVPLWNLVVFIPLGLLAGTLIRKMGITSRRKRRESGTD